MSVGVSAWGAIARNEPSKRSEIVHDIWYMPDAEGGTSLRWAALRIGHMKLLQGSGANDWVRPKPDPRAIERSEKWVLVSFGPLRLRDGCWLRRCTTCRPT